MKPILAVVALVSLHATAASASPIRDDRYFVAWGGGASSLDVTTAVRKSRRHHPRHRERRPAPKPGTVAPISLAKGLRREMRRALPHSVRLTGVVPRLAEKASQIVADCGSRVISAVRHTYVAGTRRISLHASGRAVDLAGAPGCIYAHLRGWPGGYSTDYARVRHVHVSYDPHGRREWGVRFAHGGGRHRTMSARSYARRR